MQSQLPVDVKGHVNIKDDLGNVLLDQDNAVHPQNVARIIARAMAYEHNFYIHRIAFGNGGTQIGANLQIEYNEPQDGQPPRDTRTWDSRIYNETYSEIINEGQISLNTNLGTDPGSSGVNVPSRPGGGASPEDDPDSTPHVSGPGVRSNELGLQSEVVITAYLNPDEPAAQLLTDDQSDSENPESDFMFDEIGLYTTGSPGAASSGFQNVDVGTKTSTDDTTLLAGTSYNFYIAVDGGTSTQISFTTPPLGGSGANGEILYGDLCEALNTGDTDWDISGSNNATVSITDYSGNFNTIAGAQTYGYLRYESPTTGSTSTISLQDGSSTTNPLFENLNDPNGGNPLTAVSGEDAGVQNDPVNPDTERERLLTHIIFSPVLKSSNRSLMITYTLTVSVARTD